MSAFEEAAPVSPENALGCLRPAIRFWFISRYQAPTTIQCAAWPVVSCGKNVLLSASTGSGKTLAAFLPLLDGLLTSPSTSVRILYISPMKALAADVRRTLRSCLARMSYFLEPGTILPRVTLRTGDTTTRDRKRLWEEPPAVLLTTPETLSLLLTYPGASELFRDLRHVIIDEIHSLAPGKRGADLSVSLERLEQMRGPLQRIGLSATATPLYEAARYLVGADRPCCIATINDPVSLELTIRPLPQGITFLSNLLDVVSPLLETNRTVLLFTNTRALAERLSWALWRRHPAWDDQIAVHHSSLAANRRRRIERRLKRGRLRAVVCSTSLELGIDIGSVDLVVLVHPPGDVVRLLQRVGRAGHSPGQPRRGLVLTSGPAELLEAAVTNSSGQDAQTEPMRIASWPLDVLCQQLLGMAASGIWTPDDAFAVIRRASPFRDLSRPDFEAALEYLSGGPGDVFASRLHREGETFQLLNEKTLRIVRRNIGTIIAEETCEVVREVGEDSRLIGSVDISFAEQLQPGERFLLDGLCLEYRRLQRGTGRAGASRLCCGEVIGRPRAPKWAGEGLPMSSQLVERLFLLRSRAGETLRDGREALATLFQDEYELPPEAVDELIALLTLQESVSEIPEPGGLLIESVAAQSLTTYYLHTPLHRKGNDALARVVSTRLGRLRTATPPLPCLVADLGFVLYVRGEELSLADIRQLLHPALFVEELHKALADSLVLRERFQRIALTGLLVLRNPLNRRRVGGHDWAERRLFDQVRERVPDFVLLRQAQREILAEVCDGEAARRYLDMLLNRSIRCRKLARPSPFVETWTQAEPTQSAPPPTPEELLRQLQASLFGTEALS